MVWKKYEKEKTGKSITEVRDMVIKAVRIGNLSTPVNEFLVGIVVFGIIAYGGYQVAAGQTTAGELLSFITAFTLAYEPMKKLARLNNSLQMGLGAADRVFAMLDTNAKIKEIEDAADVVLQTPEIVFDNVSFTYEDGERQAVDAVNLTLPAGEGDGSGWSIRQR
jgi:subfamily B ATP-binding cassette protein MsbA